MRPLGVTSVSFYQRAIANHLLFASMAFVVVLWSWLAGPGSIEIRFSKQSFSTLAAFVDYKQVGIPLGGAFALYLFISLLAHQSQGFRADETAYHWRELIHAEVSSILLSSSSLSLVVGFLFFWAGAYEEALWPTLWWPIGFFLAFLLRPKSQDRKW